jgi:protein phosphatase 1L
VSIFGVFDGHGGDSASDYAVRMVPSQLLMHSAFHSDRARALTEAFLQTDRLWVTNANHDALYQGTTGVLAVLDLDRRLITVANAGDSRCILCRRPTPDQQQARLQQLVLAQQQKITASRRHSSSVVTQQRTPLIADELVVPLSIDHKPDRADETRRIVSTGGHVIRHSERGISFGPHRVYTADSLGGLAVSRSIGDSVFRLPPHDAQPLVIATPEVLERRLEQSDFFLILASDGLWDVFTNGEACEWVLQRNGSPDQAAQALVEEAYRRGSSDNITVVVVFLPTFPSTASSAVSVA